MERSTSAVQNKRLSKKDIEKVFEGKLADNTTLITDKHYSYRAFVKDNLMIKYKSLLAKDQVDKPTKKQYIKCFK